MLSEIQGALAKGLAEIVILLIGLVCAYITLYLAKAAQRLQEETRKIKSQAASEAAANAIARVTDVARTVVEEFEQTVAGDLRQAVKDGKVSRDELLALGTKARDKVLSTLSTETVEALKATVGDVQGYITSLIESQVRQVKMQSKLQEALSSPKA